MTLRAAARTGAADVARTRMARSTPDTHPVDLGAQVPRAAASA